MATPTPAALEAGFKTNRTKGGVTGVTGALSGHDYVTNDTKTQVEVAGYFNPVASYLKVGDTIEVSGDLDGTPFVHNYVVATVPTGGDVTITAQA